MSDDDRIILSAIQAENFRRGYAGVRRLDQIHSPGVGQRLGEGARRLAVYGTLAPGESNHSVLASFSGHWFDGFVRGQRSTSTWSGMAGFPAFTYDPDWPAVPIKLFESCDLVSRWRELDDFEGPNYVRILVPVDTADGTFVANLYAVRRTVSRRTTRPATRR